MKFKKTKRIKRIKNKKHTKRYKKYTKKRYLIKGGYSNNNNDNNNNKNNNNDNCPDSNVECKWLDQQFKGKLNPSWNTCISMNGIYNHIIYVTSVNVLIKSVETLQIPEFYVKFSDNPNNTKCKIMIEDKYVNCFIYLCGKWYAMMRLFGTTVNVEYLARTEKNRAFFELKNIDVNLDTKNPENSGDGVILIPSNSYTEENKSQVLSTDNSAKIIKLSDNNVININKSNDVKAFNTLQRFRQQKLYANNVKTNIAQDFAKDLIFGFFK
jgi:hypothetical protein